MTINDSIALLSIHRVRVLGANLISGDITWGFPSPTAFLGFAHALERKVRGRFDIRLGGVGIVCHEASPQTVPDQYHDHHLCLTKNPVGEDGSQASFVEVGRLHLRISLEIEVTGDWAGNENEIAQEVADLLPTMRIAGGTTFPDEGTADLQVVLEGLPDAPSERNERFREKMRRLKRGFAICGREDLLVEHLEELRRRKPGARVTELDALMDLSRLNIVSMKSDEPEKPAKTVLRRDRSGWLIPIAVGYQAISPLYGPGKVANNRDAASPFQFVESIYTIAEWKALHRLDNYDDFIWRRCPADENAGVYRCVSNKSVKLEENK